MFELKLCASSVAFIAAMLLVAHFAGKLFSPAYVEQLNAEKTLPKNRMMHYWVLDGCLRAALRIMPFSPLTEKVALWWGYRYRPPPSVVKLRSGALIQTTHVDHLQLLLYYTGTFEPQALDTMRKHVKRGDVILDVGANIGLFTVEGARAVGPSGHVISIEAAPHHANTIEKVVKINGMSNVEVISSAVGDVSGEAILTLPRSSNFGMFTLGDVDGDEKFTVSVRTIDDILLGRKIDFLKMDIEGYEYRALVGARDTIRNSRPTILIELNEAALRSCGSSSKAIKMLLARYGYVGTMMNGSPIVPDMEHICDECLFVAA